jgi:hypothetical protein
MRATSQILPFANALTVGGLCAEGVCVPAAVLTAWAPAAGGAPKTTA